MGALCCHNDILLVLLVLVWCPPFWVSRRWSDITVVDAVSMHTEYIIFLLLGVIPFSSSSVFQGSMLKRFPHTQSAPRGWSSLPVCEKSFSCAGNNCHFYLLASRGLLLFSWTVQSSALGHAVCVKDSCNYDVICRGGYPLPNQLLLLQHPHCTWESSRWFWFCLYRREGSCKPCSLCQCW